LWRGGKRRPGRDRPNKIEEDQKISRGTSNERGGRICKPKRKQVTKKERRLNRDGRKKTEPQSKGIEKKKV